MTFALRPVRDGDAQDLFGLLALCFAEYPGCFVDPHEDLADLREPTRTFAKPGEGFWVLEDERGRVAACVGLALPSPKLAELHRLYVRPDRRRRGLGERLVLFAEEAARAAGAVQVVLWSDTRFAGAHRLYGRLGYSPLGTLRELGDVSGSIEAGFEKGLGPGTA